jgi:nucleoside-diphosphate-sugar epimerase
MGNALNNSSTLRDEEIIVAKDDPILITGANGFIGSRVVKTLQAYGFENIRCFVRSSRNLAFDKDAKTEAGKPVIRVVEGNLLSLEDCRKATEGAVVIYHLAAARGEKSYSDAFLNTVVTTNNLLKAVLEDKGLKRFLNVSSFIVYSNRKIQRGGLVDESCEMEAEPMLRGEAYCYAKVKQDELLLEYRENYGIPIVIVRPGVVYGPGNKGMTGRVGIDTFGVYLHLGGSNLIPMTYVDNCADAIVRAGLFRNADGEVFNVVDDDLPTSRSLLRMYKKEVGAFRSFYIPKALSYFLCFLWEKYSAWSQNQLPPLFNRRRWSFYWKGNRYSNEKIKTLLGWKQPVQRQEALARYFEYQRANRKS